MPKTITLADHHLILMRLTLKLMRTAAADFFGSSRAASSSDLVLITMAVAIGQIERAPMSSTKIAAYIGMPRVTTLRKLGELHARGLVDKSAANTYTLPLHKFNAPHVHAAVASLARSVHQASTALSKLDR